MVQAALLSSNTEYWETPIVLFNQLNEEFGFTLDVCANESNKKCDRFISEEEDALQCDWGTNVCWMNPPYGKKMYSFMQKAHESCQKGATVVCLVPSRTDTQWWHDFVYQHEVSFIKGRLKFGNAQNPAPFPSAIVVMRPKAGGESV